MRNIIGNVYRKGEYKRKAKFGRKNFMPKGMIIFDDSKLDDEIKI